MSRSCCGGAACRSHRRSYSGTTFPEPALGAGGTRSGDWGRVGVGRVAFVGAAWTGHPAAVRIMIEPAAYCSRRVCSAPRVELPDPGRRLLEVGGALQWRRVELEARRPDWLPIGRRLGWGNRPGGLVHHQWCDGRDVGLAGRVYRGREGESGGRRSPVYYNVR